MVKRGSEKEIDLACKTLAYGFLILLFFSFLVGFVDTKAVISGHAWKDLNIFDLQGMLGIGEGEVLATQVLIAKYIFFFTMIFILMWASELLFKGYGLVKLLIAAGVSWLAITFLVQGEIVVALTTFSALGILFMVGLPALAILLITSRLLELKSINAQRLLIQRVIWLAYSAFLLYYLLSTTQFISILTALTGGGGLEEGWGLTLIVLVIFGVSIFLFLKNDVYVKAIKGVYAKAGELKVANKRIKAVEEREARLISKIQAFSDEAAEQLSGRVSRQTQDDVAAALRGLVE
jgi:hypothetical protein